MKSLSFVQYHLRQKNFYDSFTHSSNALRNEISNKHNKFLLNFWLLVSAAVLNSSDFHISHEFESLIDENRTFEYPILCAILWYCESVNDGHESERTSKIDLRRQNIERYSSVDSIVLAAELYMYRGSYGLAETLLRKVHQTIGQKSSSLDIQGEFYRVSAWLYTMSNGTTTTEPEGFHHFFQQMQSINLDCLLAIGTYFVLIGQHEEAMKTLNHVIKIDQSFFPAHLELSKVLLEAKDIDAAQEHSELALKYSESDFLTASHSIILSFLVGNEYRACDILKTLLDDILIKEAHYHVVKYSQLCQVVSRVSNQNETAAVICVGIMAHICDSDPENTKYRLDFAHLLRRAGKYQDAISLYEFISSLDDTLDALEGMSLSNALKGNLLEARQQYELYQLMTENSINCEIKLDHILLKLLLKDTNVDEAIDAMVKHIDLRYATGIGVANIDISTVTRICNIILLEYKYHLPEIVSELVTCLSKISEWYFNGEFVYMTSKFYTEIDQVQRAMDTIVSFQERCTLMPSMHVLKAHVYLSMGNVEDASGSLDRAINLEAMYQNEIYFIAVKAWVMFLNNDGKNGKYYLHKLIFESYNVSSGMSWGDKKRCLLIYGHYGGLSKDDKLQLLPIVDTEAKYSNCFDLIYLLSKLEVSIGSTLNALHTFDRISRSSADYSLGRHAKAWTYFIISGDHNAFLSLLNKLAQDDASLESYVYLGQAYAKLGNNNEALLSYLRAMSINPGNEDAVMMVICGSLECERKCEIALALCERHLTDYPRHMRVKLLKARFLDQLGDWDSSVDVYNDILSSWDERLYPQINKIGVHIEAAKIYHRNNEFDSATEVLQEAKEWCELSESINTCERSNTKNEWFYIQMNLAKNFVSQRHFTQAIQILKEFFDNGYTDITALKMIALSYFECKMNDQCYNWSVRILEDNPNDEDAKYFLRVLSKDRNSNQEIIHEKFK